MFSIQFLPITSLRTWMSVCYYSYYPDQSRPRVLISTAHFPHPGVFRPCLGLYHVITIKNSLNEHVIKMRLMIKIYSNMLWFKARFSLISTLTCTNLTYFCVICCDEEWGLMAVSTFEEIIPVIRAGNWFQTRPDLCQGKYHYIAGLMLIMSDPVTKKQPELQF